MAKNNSLYPTVYLYSDQSEASLEIQDESTGIAGTVVRFDTNLISDKNQFYVELFNSKGSAAILTPKTANNFLKYVNDNSYQNTFVHRSIDGFMIQAGGFTAPSLQMIAGGIPLEIDSKGPIKNEPGNENIRGTLSMAKLGGDPDSATNQWFINLVDNDFLNSQNGGFTAFGKVLGNGMEVVDLAAGVPIFPEADQWYKDIFGGNGLFKSLPLKNVTITEIDDMNYINLQPDDFLKFTTIAEISDNKDLFTYHVKSSKPKKLSVEVLNNHTINMKPAAAKSGRVQVRVQASSLIDDSKITEHFFVEIPKSKRKSKPLKGSRSNDLLAGDNNSNTIIGRQGDDQIFGYNDNDKLIGGKGKDFLMGGQGADFFIYKSIKDSSPGSKTCDVIIDFSSESGDRIDLSRIRMKKSGRKHASFKFINESAFTNSPGEMRFSDGLLEVNTDNDSKADFAIKLLNVDSFSEQQLIF